jgi:hypothetical protein
MAQGIKEDVRLKVIAVANSLELEGNSNPTAVQVRERMGGGSPNLINPALKMWKESRSIDLHTCFDITSSAREAASVSFNQLFNIANNLAVTVTRQENMILLLKQRVAELEGQLKAKGKRK